MKSKIKLLFMLFIIVLSAATPYNSVLAVTTNEFMDDNDIMFYDPAECPPVAAYDPGTGALTPAGMYDLPATSGKAGLEEAFLPDGTFASNGSSGAFGKLAKRLTQDYRDYYITMRWTYAAWNWAGGASGIDVTQNSWIQKEPRIVLVTNPRTGKSIYAVALDSGPQPRAGASQADHDLWGEGYVRGTPDGYKGRVSGFPPIAFTELGIAQGMGDGSGDVLTYQWAPDQSVKPGPVTDGSTAIGGSTSSATATPAGCDNEVSYNANKATVASDILTKYISNIAISGVDKKQIEDIRDGKQSDAWDCGVNVYILNIIAALAKDHKISITSLNRACKYHGTAPPEGNGTVTDRHYAGNGSAVDLVSFDGTHLAGEGLKSEATTTLLDIISPIMAEASKAGKANGTANSVPRVGQSQCGITRPQSLPTSDYPTFEDTCNHLHIDVSPNADRNLECSSKLLSNGDSCKNAAI